MARSAKIGAADAIGGLTDLTITVTISPLARGILAARCWLAATLIRLGCAVGGIGYEVSEGE